MIKLTCAICQEPMFESSPDVKRIKKGGPWRTAVPAKSKNFQVGVRAAVKKPAIPITINANPILASRCGHIFHKKCITNYMRVFRSELKRSGVECPCCKCQVILAVQSPIDFLASEKCAQVDEKELRVLQAVNKELKEQTVDLTQRLNSIEHKIKNTLEKIPLDESLADINDGLKGAEEKAKRAEFKAQRASERFKKAEAIFQEIKERAARLDENWKLAEGDTKKIQELIELTEEMTTDKAEPSSSSVDGTGEGEIKTKDPPTK